MASELTLSIVAPDRAVLEEQVHSVVAPGSEGYFGIMRGHVPMIAGLKPGYVEFQDAQGQRHFVAVGGGFIEVTAEKVSVLAESAERATEIDIVKAEEELERARTALRGGESPMTRQEATLEIERAMNRLRVAQRK